MRHRLILTERTFRRAATALLLLAGMLGCGWYFLPRPPAPLEEVSYSQKVLDRNGQLLRLTLSRDDKFRVYTSLSDISPELVGATLLQEDRQYWRHPGINPVAVLRAGWHFCLAHSGRGGASTVSMQLARIRYGLSTRTLRGKLAQMYRALQLERHYSKAQILESYLNLAPYGRNIEGVGAASLLYFGKAPDRLTLHEAVALTVIPQSPARRAPRTSQENVSLTRATARLYARVLAASSERPQEDAAVDDFRPESLGRRAFAAPHFVNRVLEANAGGSEIRTTLDLRVQETLERRIRAYMEARHDVGVQNAAAMLVDTQSMEVLAQVGSADFFDKSIGGEVDGTRRPRSPGSTLKPFIYALAIDQGLIHPLTLLKDTPRSFAGYNPENFDRDFVGPIRAADALARSRNIPAVSLAAELARPGFYGFLKGAGLRLPHREDFYGLALPLGGGEVSMEELVNLYAALANAGQLRPLLRTQPLGLQTAGKRIVSREAAFLTLEMLGESSRPGLNEGTGAEGIYWKTGTSHGFHDAWSVAVFDHYVLAVWIGNFDGRSNPVFIGRTCAAPLLFSIIDAVRPPGASRAPHQPPPTANLQRVEFCAISGELPGPACTHRVTGWFVPGVSPIASCRIHREVLLDTETGLRVARDDGSRTLRREVFEFWPSDLLSLFRKAGVPRRQPPPFLPGSEAGLDLDRIARGGYAPRILSPQSGRTYSIRSDGGSGDALPLHAQAEGDVARLYWFADTKFIGSSSPAEPVYWKPSPGTYKVVALDDSGRSASSTVVLEAAPE